MKKRYHALLAAALLTAAPSLSADPSEATWTGASETNNLWSNPGNWLDGIVPDGDFIVKFGDVPDAARIVDLDIDVELTLIDFEFTGGSVGYQLVTSNDSKVTFINADNAFRGKVDFNTSDFGVTIDVALEMSTSTSRIFNRNTDNEDLIIARPITILPGATLQLGSVGVKRLQDTIAGAFMLTGGPVVLDAVNAEDIITYAGNITGTAASAVIDKEGLGLVILSGSNSYDRPTNILEGRMDVNGTTADSLFTVTDSAVLGGLGSAGNVIVENGGMLAAGSGATVGTFTVLDLELSANSELLLRLDGLGDPQDQLVIDGDLLLDGFLAIENLGGLEEGIYTLITYSGDLTDNGLAFGNMPSGFTYQLLLDSPGQINLSVIPEPSSLLLLLLALGSMGSRKCLRRFRVSS